MIDCGTYRVDRCDRCGAAALHTLERNGLDLLLCGHHYNQHENSLRIAGWKLTSELSTIK